MHLASFCPRCAAELVRRIPTGDERERSVCPACGYVAYVNPKVAAGTVPVRDGRVALIRRGVEPAVGSWSWPCGYVEIDERVEDCARRETHEETGLHVGLGPMLGLYSYPVDAVEGHLMTTGLIIVAWATTSVEGELVAGTDAEDAAWFAPDAIPWDDLAFDSSHRGLRDLLARLR